MPGRWWRRTDEIYDTVRIGAGLLASGRLAEDRIETRGRGDGGLRALLRRERHPAPRTSARSRRARSATPRTAASCSRACASATGLPARVLSSEEEAYYGYLAAVNSTTLRDGAVLDLGGGSLQLVRVARPPSRRRAPRGRSARCA